MVSNIFLFSPNTWGRFPFWLIFFKGLKPPTRYSCPYFGVRVFRRHDPWPMLRRIKHGKCMVKLCSVFGLVMTSAVSGICKRRQKTSQLLHDRLCNECNYLFKFGWVFFFLNYAFAHAQFFAVHKHGGLIAFRMRIVSQVERTMFFQVTVWLMKWRSPNTWKGHKSPSQKGHKFQPWGPTQGKTFY